MNCKVVLVAFWKFSFFHAFSLNVQRVVVGIAVTAVAWAVGELLVRCHLKDQALRV